MKRVDTIAALEALYGNPVRAALDKVSDRLTESYRTWIEASRFCVLSTVGPGGTDASPRGDDAPVARVADDRTLLLPDWRGNDRIDSLRNIVVDGRVSLMFFVPGSSNVVRVNGTGFVTADADVLARFERGGRRPRSVVVVETAEVYFQCARAIARSGLWSGAPAPVGLPTPGGMLAEMTRGEIDGKAYDADWPERAARTLW